MLMGIESPHDRILKLFNKGFTRRDIENAFSVLRDFPFYYHGYFIFGNIGETEEEMLYISEFADRIGVDSISAQKLRLERYSSMKDIVEKTPGYHYNDTGFVYSDTYDIDRLGRIGKEIKRRFYTPSRLWRIIKKAGSTGIFTREDLLYIIPRIPVLLMRFVVREIEKKTGKLRKRLRRYIPLKGSAHPQIEIKKRL